MQMLPLGDTPQEHSQGKATTGLFLSLYLVLLAFFIMLVSISTVEQVKTKALRDSLSSTFAGDPLRLAESMVVSRTGDVVAARDFHGRVGQVFEAAIPAAQIKVIKQGDLMQVSFAADDLFLPNRAELRTAQAALLDRLIAAMANPPQGSRYDMELLIGSPAADDGSLPIGETLESGRAGAFAREMVRRGALPDRIQIALDRGDPTQVRLRFHVRGLDEGRLKMAPAQ